MMKIINLSYRNFKPIIREYWTHVMKEVPHERTNPV